MSRAVLLASVAFFLCFGLLAYGQQSAAQKLGPGFGQRYLLLETNLASTLEQELRTAAAAGYRVIGGWSAYVLLLEQVAAPPATYDYRLLSTMRRSTLEKEVREAGQAGYRLVPQAAVAGNTLVMEKAPDSTTRYDYLFLPHTFTADPSTGRPLTTSLENVSLKAALRGYSVVGVDCMSFGDDATALRTPHVFIAEKSGGADAAPPELGERERYLIARAGRPEDVDAFLGDAANKGYRLALASQGSCPDIVLMMEDVGRPGPAYEYALVNGQDLLDTAAAYGFHPHASGLLTGLGIVMERRAGAGGDAGRYFLVEHGNASVLQGRLIDAGVQGFDVVVASRTKHSVIARKGADRTAEARAIEAAAPSGAPATATAKETAKWPRVFVRPMSGFEDYVISALKTKDVPVLLTFAPEDAALEMVGAIKISEPSKAVRFLDGMGEPGATFPRKLEVKVTVRDVKTGAVVFDHTVTKRSTLEGMPEYSQRAANDWAEEWARKLKAAKPK